MADWTHNICEACWSKMKPGQRPVVLIGGDVDICCWCGEPTTAGIYLREDPAKLMCKGEHEDGGE